MGYKYENINNVSGKYFIIGNKVAYKTQQCIDKTSCRRFAACPKHSGDPAETVIRVANGNIFRADSRFAPSQWETALLCNDVSHWLGANLEPALGRLSTLSCNIANLIADDKNYSFTNSWCAHNPHHVYNNLPVDLYMDSKEPIRSQFCTCHSSRAVVACAKLVNHTNKTLWQKWFCWDMNHELIIFLMKLVPDISVIKTWWYAHPRNATWINLRDSADNAS